MDSTLVLILGLMVSVSIQGISHHYAVPEICSVANRTHWQQCRLLLSEPLAVNRGQRIVGTIRFRTNNNRSYDLDLNIHVVSDDAKNGKATVIPNTQRTGRFDLGKQTYNYSYNPDAAMAGMLNM